MTVSEWRHQLSFTPDGVIISVTGNSPHRTSAHQLTPQEQKSTNMIDRSPMDNLDSCCQVHDKCHAQSREDFPCDAGLQRNRLTECDRALANCAENSNVGGPRAWGVKKYMQSSDPNAELNFNCPPPLKINNLFITNDGNEINIFIVRRIL